MNAGVSERAIRLSRPTAETEIDGAVVSLLPKSK